MRHVRSGTGGKDGGGGACGAGDGYAWGKEGRVGIGRWACGATSAGTFRDGGNAGNFSTGEQFVDRQLFDKQFFRKQYPANHGAVILRIEHACR